VTLATGELTLIVGFCVLAALLLVILLVILVR